MREHGGLWPRGSHVRAGGIVGVQVAAEGEGIEDLVAGLVSGAFYLGTSAGPLLSGATVALVGFPWTMTGLAAVLLLHWGVQGIIARSYGLYRHTLREVTSAKSLGYQAPSAQSEP